MSDIRTLDLNLLKALDALLDEGSVTKAASRLALTQPAVSGMLNRLRERFDDPLFIRTQRGIVPTPRAVELAEPIKRVLGEIDALLQPPTFDPATANFTFRLAATDYAQHAILVPFLAALRRRAPGIRVAALPIDDLQLAGRLERGEYHLALITPDKASSDCHTKHLFDEQYVCVLRSGHPAITDHELSLESFCDLDHAIVSYGGGAFHGVTDEALDRLGRRRRVVLSVTSFLILREILRKSDLVAVVPRRLVSGEAGLEIIEPPLALPGFAKIAAWHARTHADLGHRWVRALIAETCNSLL